MIGNMEYNESVRYRYQIYSQCHYYIRECSHGHILLQLLLHESRGEQPHLVVVAVGDAPVLSPAALSSPVVLPDIKT